MSNFFRIDDVSVNTDPVVFERMVSLLRAKHPNCRIMAAVSPCVHNMPGSERVFPAILNRESNHTLFYKVDKVGIPEDLMKLCDEVAAHGMAHVDHRLLHEAAQEMSIVMSCSLVGCKVFVPPFHKYSIDGATDEVCIRHGIKLVKLHDRMVHLGHGKVTADRDYYYFHTHDFKSMEDFESRL